MNFFPILRPGFCPPPSVPGVTQRAGTSPLFRIDDTLPPSPRFHTYRSVPRPFPPHLRLCFPLLCFEHIVYLFRRSYIKNTPLSDPLFLAACSHSFNHPHFFPPLFPLFPSSITLLCRLQPPPKPFRSSQEDVIPLFLRVEAYLFEPLTPLPPPSEE